MKKSSWQPNSWRRSTEKDRGAAPAIFDGPGVLGVVQRQHHLGVADAGSSIRSPVGRPVGRPVRPLPQGRGAEAIEVDGFG